MMDQKINHKEVLNAIITNQNNIESHHTKNKLESLKIIRGIIMKKTILKGIK